MKGKNFFYRVNPESVLSELTSINYSEWLQFFLDFFHDLRSDNPDTTKSNIAASIIRESHNFRQLRSKAGKASAQQKSTNVQHMLKDVQPVAVAVAVAVAETEEESENFSPSGDEEQPEKWISRKKRNLTGKRLETFKKFWAAFDYKTGRAEAIDAWLDIPQLTDSLVAEIVTAAEKEASRRPGIITSGRTPKMAQGWITARRWEDEPTTKTGGINSDWKKDFLGED